jgi:hypothetical protein
MAKPAAAPTANSVLRFFSVSTTSSRASRATLPNPLATDAKAERREKGWFAWV